MSIIFLLCYVNGFSFQLPPNGSITNPCSEGEFYDLNASICRPLCKPDLGFDIDRFNQASSSTVYTLNQCTHTALNNLLNSIGPQGGIIQLPACTITIAGKVWLTENTILQGAGIGQTVIQAAPGYTGHMLEMRKIKNSVLRDLTIDGNGQYVLSSITWYCDNVLIERVEVKNSARTGIDFRYSKHVTIRYCVAHGAGAYHGIASKDCSNASPLPDHEHCSNEAGNTSPGVLWTTNYAIYSNDTYNNTDHGFLSHALNGEIAGNRAANNGFGAKFFDGENILIHHNTFEGNANYGTSVNWSIDIPERLPGNLVFFENEYLNNGAQPFKISGWSTIKNDYVELIDIYLLNNYFAGNTPNEIRNVTLPGILKICPGSQEDQMPYYGTSAVGYATPGECLDPCSIDAGKCLTVRLKLALEGALDDNGQYRSAMRTNLYASRKLLPGQTPPPPALPTPPGQPYSVAPWNYSGTEGLNFDQTAYENLEAEYGAAPVDWVLVSFRRQATDTGYIGRFSGVLLEDGTVILPEACMLPDSIDGSNYIMVEHLNHLPALSTNAVTFDGGYLLYDFTTSGGYSAGNLTTQLEITPGVWALYAGDPDKLNDGSGFDINGNDKILWQSQNGYFDIYSAADVNRDGNIDGADKIIWNRNNGIFSVLQK